MCRSSTSDSRIKSQRSSATSKYSHCSFHSNPDILSSPTAWMVLYKFEWSYDGCSSASPISRSRSRPSQLSE